MELKNFYNEKKVLITGNTGFKGSWMQHILDLCGAKVVGVGLKPDEKENLFEILGHNISDRTYFADVRDLDELSEIFEKEKPDIVIHMAAQPLVIESYNDPVYTYATNVMGTVNVCECVRRSESVKSFINVTTDKVYRNNEWEYPYRENDILDGYDPYSNSKSCSELVTACYKRSFYSGGDVAVSTCRAGNVIGGGDFAENRILPDCVRSARDGKPIIVRNPNSIRPYQHVLEAVMFYLQLAKAQYEDTGLSGEYNIGPRECDCLTTGTLCDLFCEKWGKGVRWETTDYDGPHEANYLRLDTSKAQKCLHWHPVWNVETAVKKTVEWYKTYIEKEDMAEYTNEQILEYLNE